MGGWELNYQVDGASAAADVRWLWTSRLTMSRAVADAASSRFSSHLRHEEVESDVNLGGAAPATANCDLWSSYSHCEIDGIEVEKD
jgi:hypothetical protein